MKAKIVAFIDQSQPVLESIETFKNDINRFCLQTILLEEAKEMKALITKEKVKVALYDPKIEGQHDDLEEQHQLYEDALSVAQLLDIEDVVYRLPKFRDVITELPSIIERVETTLKLFKKYKKNCIIHPENETSGELVYLLEKLKNKDVSVLFDPVYFFQKGEPLTKVYRLLKKYVTYVYASDVDAKGNTTLIGRGDTKMTSIFEKLKRDDYKGYIVMNDRFIDIVNDRIKPNKIMSLFTKKTEKQSKEAMKLKEILMPNEKEKNITYGDVLHNQIAVIQKMMS